jgi:hypothetical protein
MADSKLHTPLPNNCIVWLKWSGVRASPCQRLLMGRATPLWAGFYSFFVKCDIFNSSSFMIAIIFFILVIFV